MMKKIIFFCCIFFSSFIFVACTDKRPEDEPYSGGYDPEKITAITQEDGYPDIQFPVNQLVVYTEEGVEREEAVALFDSIRGVKLIGQIPSIGFYQVEVKANTREELDEIKDMLTARSEIKGASYNMLLADKADVGSCPVQPDVRLPEQPEMDVEPYDQIKYFTALEIMEGLRDTITLHPVTIGIAEDGYADNREFDDITIQNYSERNASGQRLSLLNNDEHGTAIAGIICGDNDGQGINGLASTLIGDRLSVVMARFKTRSFFDSCIAMALMIVQGGADIINGSFGHEPFSDPSEEWAQEIRQGYIEVMNHFPDVLFVFAAGNEGFEMDGNNYAPGGIRRDNSLTVSGWEHDDPSRRFSGFNYGDVVDISAPGDMIAVVGVNGLVSQWEWGTSFATPMVTSAAALLKSIGGSALSPPEIKALLLDPSFHGERTNPGGGIQLSIAHPLVDLLWQKYQGSGWTEYILDSNKDDLHDIPEIVESTICEETGVTMPEFGNFSLDQEYPCNPGISMFLEPDGTSWNIYLVALTNDGNDEMGVDISGSAERFVLNESYPFNDENTLTLNITCDNMIDESDCTFEDPVDGDFTLLLRSTTGTFSFTRCSISERTSTGEPKYLSIDIIFDCSVQGAVTTYYPSDPVFPYDIDEITSNAKGWIKNIRALTLNPMGTFDEYIEEVCTEGETE